VEPRGTGVQRRALKGEQKELRIPRGTEGAEDTEGDSGTEDAEDSKLGRGAEEEKVVEPKGNGMQRRVLKGAHIGKKSGI